MIDGRAAVGDGVGGFSIEPVVVQAPGRDEVLLELKASGVCHTDWDSLSWGRRVVLGHEGAGVVLAVGEGVTSVKAGDAVVLNWAIPCGTCYPCERGSRHICENHNQVTAGDYMQGHSALDRTLWRGVGVERSFNLGTLSTHAVVRKEAVSLIPQQMSFAAASIIGCGVMTGFGSAVNAARVEADSSVVVLGAGGVGLNVIQGCRVQGAGSIIAIDLHPKRLEWARDFGATDTLLADRDDVGLLGAAAEIRSRTGGRGADYAFECTAVPALGAAPLAMIRSGGTACQVSGIEQEIAVDMELFEWDKVYLNPLYGMCDPARDIPRILTHYQRGELLLNELVTQTYSLDQLGAAFDAMHAGENAKGVILLGD